MKITKNNEVNESKVSDELFNIVKLFFTKKRDWNCPVEVWRVWIKKDTKSWKIFVQWFMNIDKKIDVKLQEFFHQHDGQFTTFVENWVADDERTSFYEFYAEKKWEEVLLNIQKSFISKPETPTIQKHSHIE